MKWITKVKIALTIIFVKAWSSMFIFVYSALYSLIFYSYLMLEYTYSIFFWFVMPEILIIIVVIYSVDQLKKVEHKIELILASKKEE